MEKGGNRVGDSAVEQGHVGDRNCTRAHLMSSIDNLSAIDEDNEQCTTKPNAIIIPPNVMNVTVIVPPLQEKNPLGVIITDDEANYKTLLVK